MIEYKNSPKISVLWARLAMFLFGIPTPYGRVRPQAYSALAGMEQELSSLRTKYKFALKKNAEHHEAINKAVQLQFEAFQDAKRMSKMLKEVANTPHVLSAETQEALDGLRIKA